MFKLRVLLRKLQSFMIGPPPRRQRESVLDVSIRQSDEAPALSVQLASGSPSQRGRRSAVLAVGEMKVVGKLSEYRRKPTKRLQYTFARGG